MAVDMNLGQSSIDDVGSLSEEAIDCLADQVFVARYGSGRHHHCIAGHDLHLTMVPIGHAYQGGGRFSLAPCCQNDHPAGRQTVEFADIAQRVGRDGKIACFHGHSHALLHTAPGNKDAAVVPDGNIYDLLEASDKGGKRGHDHPARGPGDNVLQRIADHPLSRGIPWKLNVGGVRKEKQDFLCPQLSQSVQIGRLPDHRSMVDLEIATVHYGAHRGLNDQAHGIGYAVANGEELYGHAAQRDPAAGTNDVQLRLVLHSALLELSGYKLSAEPAGVNGKIKARQDIGQGPNMILMCVGDNDALYVSLFLQKIAYVRD